jgi:hypothetical protein
MSLSNLYIPAYYFQGGIIDKVTGFPLAGGIVTFYKDQARTITGLKPVYMLSGSPPNYSFVPLPNPITLSSIGTFQDNSGNDIVVYFFPYDDKGNQELYYITVESALGVPQFTREGEPNTANIDVNASIVTKNFISNGQFLLHNNEESYPDPDGQIPASKLESAIAPGWKFNRSSGLSIDSVFFKSFGSYVDNPTQSPRYYCELVCSSPHVGDTAKYLRSLFTDVNKFASDTQYYTLTFSAISNSGTDQSAQILVQKYYGSGGSATDINIVQNITIPHSSWTTFNIPILFGSNSGKTISGGDDTVAVVISLPPTSVYDSSFTDFSLVRGSVSLQQFPASTDTQFVSESLFSQGALMVTDSDKANMNIGLPMIYTRSGLMFDDSGVGQFTLASQNILNENPPIGFVYADGRILDSDSYSTDGLGIPFRRLQQKWADSNNFSKYGNGNDFVNAVPVSGSTFDLVVHLVQGTASIAQDGAVPTGFTFTNNSTNPVSTNITCTAGSTVTAGSYFTFTNSTSHKYVVYFIVNGIGSKPTVSGVTKYIKVLISSSDSNVVVHTKTLQAINGAYVQVPDLRGYFPRFQDGGRGLDPNAATRTPQHPWTISGDFPGTTQSDDNKDHNHTNGAQSWTEGERNDGSGDTFNPAVPPIATYINTGSSGGNEARPKNTYFSPLVKL